MASCAEAAAAANVWPAARRLAEGVACTTLCPRCQKADDTLFHEVWECDANTGEIFDNTEKLLPRGQEEPEAQACCWQRGISPVAWRPDISRESPRIWWTHEDFQKSHKFRPLPSTEQT